jgi:hypothetical protein
MDRLASERLFERRRVRPFGRVSLASAPPDLDGKLGDDASPSRAHEAHAKANAGETEHH